VSNKVNYEILHIPELEEALKNIDEDANPEDAELIKELIAKGGYKYPPETNGESVGSEQSMVLATRGARLGAQLLDFVIILPFCLPIVYFLGLFNYIEDQQPLPLFLALLAAAIGIATFLILNWKPLNQNAQTIGKKVLGLRIVKLDGSKPTIKELIFKRYLIYWAFPYIPVIGGLLNLINLLFIFRKDRRCIHDFFADTKVMIN